MPRHEEKNCARCGSLFECKTGSIALCHCSTAPLDDATREALRERYHDCLCPACLALFAHKTADVTA